LQPRFAGFSRKAGGPRSNRVIICHVISRSHDIMRYSKRFFWAFAWNSRGSVSTQIKPVAGYEDRMYEF
jgi:hypothetical protein